MRIYWLRSAYSQLIQPMWEQFVRQFLTSISKDWLILSLVSWKVVPIWNLSSCGLRYHLHFHFLPTIIPIVWWIIPYIYIYQSHSFLFIIQELCKVHGHYIQQNSRTLLPSLKSLQKSITRLHQDLADTCSSNEYLLKYLCTAGTKN